MGISVVYSFADGSVGGLVSLLVVHEDACTTFVPTPPSATPETSLCKKIVEDLEFFILLFHYAVSIGALAHYPGEYMTYETGTVRRERWHSPIVVHVP